MTSAAIINPTTDGTKALLPGIDFPVFSSLADVLIGVSLEYTTLSLLTPRFLSSWRITLAKGQTDVL